MKDGGIGKKELIAIGVGTGVVIAGGILLSEILKDAMYDTSQQLLYAPAAIKDVGVNISSNEELPELVYHKNSEK